MNDDLVTYLDAIDQRLRSYLGDDRQLRPDVVERLHRNTVALSEGSVTPGLLSADWDDYYDLAGAFVAAYGSDELQQLYEKATLFLAVAADHEVGFTDADRVFLVTLADELERYPGTDGAGGAASPGNAEAPEPTAEAQEPSQGGSIPA